MRDRIMDLIDQMESLMRREGHEDADPSFQKLQEIREEALSWLAPE